MTVPTMTTPAAIAMIYITVTAPGGGGGNVCDKTPCGPTVTPGQTCISIDTRTGVVERSDGPCPTEQNDKQ